MAVATGALVVGTLAVAGGATLATASLAGAAGGSGARVTLCHRTNSNTSPYVQTTVNVSASGIQGGHAGHTGPIWNSTLKGQGTKWGDIIPPINTNTAGSISIPSVAPFTYPGLNWTAQGQAWWSNGCQVPGGGYPPPSIGTSCAEAKVIGVGSTDTLSVRCKFAPGSAIAVTLNGHAYSTATAPPSGIFVEKLTSKAPHSIALNGGPAVSTTLGAVNTFVASGTNQGGGTNPATTIVILSANEHGNAKQHHG